MTLFYLIFYACISYMHIHLSIDVYLYGCTSTINPCESVSQVPLKAAVARIDRSVPVGFGFRAADCQPWIAGFSMGKWCRFLDFLWTKGWFDHSWNLSGFRRIWQGLNRKMVVLTKNGDLYEWNVVCLCIVAKLVECLIGDLLLFLQIYLRFDGFKPTNTPIRTPLFLIMGLINQQANRVLSQSVYGDVMGSI